MTPEQCAKSGTELAEQMALFAWIAFNKRQYPVLSLLFAIKNEEKSGSKVVGGRFKASGVKSGVHDLMLPVGNFEVVEGRYIPFNGLFIEMKKLDGSPSKEQLEFGEAVEANGYAWEVCYGWEHAVRVLIAYLEGRFVQKDVEHQKLKYNKKG